MFIFTKYRLVDYLSLFIILIVFSCCFQFFPNSSKANPPPPPPPERYISVTVTELLNNDAIKIKNEHGTEHTVLISGLQTKDIPFANDPENRNAIKAKEFLSQLIPPGSEIYVDMIFIESKRSLRRNSKIKLINQKRLAEEVIRNGYGVISSPSRLRHEWMEELRKTEIEAQKNKSGLWKNADQIERIDLEKYKLPVITKERLKFWSNETRQYVNEKNHLLEIAFHIERNPDFAKTSKGEKELSKAVNGGLLSSAKLLLDYGADSNLSENIYGNLLLKALSQKKEQIAIILIEYGAKTDVYNGRNGYGAIHYASMHGYIEMLRLVIDRGENVNRKTIAGRNWNCAPLHRAARAHVDATRLLLKRGAYVNILNNLNQTPLHYAAESGCFECAKSLIEHKALVNCIDQSGNTPLLSFTTKVSNFSRKNFFEKQVEFAQYLIRSGADINATNNEGKNTLHCLVLNKFNPNFFPFARNISKLEQSRVKNLCKITQVLIDAGVDINQKDNGGGTPLWWAIQNGFNEVAKVLKRNGAK